MSPRLSPGRDKLWESNRTYGAGTSGDRGPAQFSLRVLSGSAPPRKTSSANVANTGESDVLAPWPVGNPGYAESLEGVCQDRLGVFVASFEEGVGARIQDERHSSLGAGCDRSLHGPHCVRQWFELVLQVAPTMPTSMARLTMLPASP